MAHPEDDVGFADEAPDFADEAPDTEDGYGDPAAEVSDPALESHLDFGAEAASNDDDYMPDESFDAPGNADAIADDLADDAGSGASYGFEATAAQFEGGDVEGLGEDSNLRDADDEYNFQDTGGYGDASYADEAAGDDGYGSGTYAEASFNEAPEGDAAVAGFAEEAATLDQPDFAAADGDAAGEYGDAGGYGDDEAGYGEVPAYEDGGYSEPAEGYDDGGYDDGGYDEDEGEAEVQGFSFTQPADPEPEPEPEPEPQVEEAQGFGDVGAGDDGKSQRSGQVAKSALDEIFARAAQIKRDRKT